MYGYEKEKPKGLPPLETAESIRRDYRNFYWRLLIILMIPACILGSIFMLPVITFNQVNSLSNPSVAHLEDCYASDSGRKVHISSEPYNYLKSAEPRRAVYRWSADSGDTWKTVMRLNSTSHFIETACDYVQFGMDYTLLYDGMNMTLIRDDGLTASTTACENDFIERANLNEEDNTSSKFIFDIQCKDNTLTQVTFNLNAGD